MPWGSQPPDDDIGELVALDRIVHEPVRLVVLSALLECRSANFTFLRSMTRTTAGNLGAHLNVLREHGLIEMTRSDDHGRPQTVVRLTPGGRRAVRSYWRTVSRAARRHL